MPTISKNNRSTAEAKADVTEAINNGATKLTIQRKVVGDDEKWDLTITTP